MGLTLTQKILKTHLVNKEDSVEPGKEVLIKADMVLTQDSTGTAALQAFEAMGLPRSAVPGVNYIDHTCLGFQGMSAEDHVYLQTGAAKFGLICSKAGNGVCHQVQYERFGKPGMVWFGSDSHTPTGGGLGALAIGVGGISIALLMSGEPYRLKVPPIVKVNLGGELPPYVEGKDVILELLRRLTTKGGTGKIFEFLGPGIKSLTVPQRCTITNMGAELGLTSSLFPSDEITKEFLKHQQREKDFIPFEPDPDASYCEEIELNLSELRPLVAMPFSPDNVKKAAEIKSQRVNQVIIVSCTNGGYEYLKMAADYIRGKKASLDLEFIVIPASRQAYQMALKDGSIETLINAGARIEEPGCAACIGQGFVPGEGHFSLRTTNRNWKGRGGAKDTNLALTGIGVAVATALKGEIADPSELNLPLPKKVNYKETQAVVDDCLLIFPPEDSSSVEIKRSSNIVPLIIPEPIPFKFKGKVLLKPEKETAEGKSYDGISTDDIMPATGTTQALRSNLPGISKYCFSYLTPDFAQKAEQFRDENAVKKDDERLYGIIVGGENYGQGSSREHAAMAPMWLGIKTVIAKSFARIHQENLVLWGIFPLTADADEIDEGDELEFDLAELKNRGPVRIKNLTKNKEILPSYDLTDEQIEIILKGGALAKRKKELA